MDRIAFEINGQNVTGETGSTIIEVARAYGIPIPTLCHDPCLESIGACRVCLVEDEKRGSLVAACVTPIAKDMSIITDSQKVIESRTVVVKLLLASHPESCIVCEKGNRCALRQIAADLGIGLIDYYPMPNYTGTQEVNPFILRDLSKCILCAKCIRADHELVVEGAIDYMGRGFEARPATLTDGPLELSECTFCGVCVELCPTGALFERDKRFRSSAGKRVLTTCSFCGCGCSFWIEVSGNQAVGVRPGIDGSVNGMTLCVKGHYGCDYINHPDRLLKPLVKKEGIQEEASWDEALKHTSECLKTIMGKSGGESIAILTGPHCTNEEAFLMKKIATDILKTDHVICSSEMSNVIEGMEDALGYAGSKNLIQDLEDSEAILLIGANPTETAPIVGYSIKRGIRKNQTSLIVIDPVEIKLTQHARQWLCPFINSDLLLLSGFIALLVEELINSKKVSDKDTDALKEILNRFGKFSLDDLEGKTGVSIDSLKSAALLFIEASKRAIVFGNGITLQPQGKDLVKLVCSIGTIADRYSNGETALFPLVYQSNAMGCYHMGLMNGGTPEKIFREIQNGSIKGLWVIGDDPAVSCPDAEMESALDKLEFLAVSNAFLAKTGRRADVVFPSTTFAEKSGTITNMEGRVQRIQPAIEPVGESKPDWFLISNVADCLGVPFSYKSEKDITKDIVKSVPRYSGMKIPKRDTDYFSFILPSDAKKDAVIFIPDDISVDADADNAYPYNLLFGSLLFQTGFGYQTGRSLRLGKIIEKQYVSMNPEDAEGEHVQEGDMIRLISKKGEKRIRAYRDVSLPRGILLLPLPFVQDSNLWSFHRDGGVRKTCRIKIERVKS